MSYIFTWQSWFSDGNRKSVRESKRERERKRVVGGGGETEREKRQGVQNKTKKGSHGFLDSEWLCGDQGGCIQIRNTCMRLPSQHMRLWNGGAEALICCLRTGQAWDGENDMETEPVPVSSHPILGERGEDGRSGWIYVSTLGLRKVLRPSRGSFIGMVNIWQHRAVERA